MLFLFGDAIVQEQPRKAEKRGQNEYDDGKAVSLGAQGVSPDGGCHHRGDAGDGDNEKPMTRFHRSQTDKIADEILWGAREHHQ